MVFYKFTIANLPSFHINLFSSNNSPLADFLRLLVFSSFDQLQLLSPPLLQLLLLLQKFSPICFYFTALLILSEIAYILRIHRTNAILDGCSIVSYTWDGYIWVSLGCARNTLQKKRLKREEGRRQKR